MRTESPAAELVSRYIIFWQEAGKLSGSKHSPPQNVDNISGESNTAELLSRDYSSDLNIVKSQKVKALLDSTLSNNSNKISLLISIEKVWLFPSKLSANICVSTDLILSVADFFY